MSRTEAGGGRCYTCRLEGWSSPLRKESHEIPLRNLHVTAEDGTCTTCSLIRDAVTSFAPAVGAELGKAGLGGNKAELTAVAVSYHSFVQVSLCYDFLNSDAPRMIVPLDLFQDADKLPDTLPNALGNPPARLVSRNLPCRLEIPWVAELTQTWIRQCAEFHMVCTVVENPQLPIRILDLGDPRVQDTSTMKLKVSGGERGHYIALSYRWGANAGGGSTLLTTTTLLADRLKGIPWQDIPQTFRDAIKLSWALGVRYLWIDSLCILQDDEADWDKEAASMAEVYENSFLTVAATLGPDNKATLFTERWTQFQSADSRYTINPRIASQLIIRSASSGAAEQNPFPTSTPAAFVRHRLHVAHDRFLNGDNAQQHAVDSPLLTRAWSFQERLLAPRTLHFHAEEMVWECKTDMRCECGQLDTDPRSFPRRYPVRKAKGPHAQPRKETRLTPGTAPRVLPSRAWLKSSMAWAMLQPESSSELVWIWLDLVSEYLQLELTYEKDRLPALSGLAASFARPELGRYLAGMWEAALPEGLLFRVVYPEDVQNRVLSAAGLGFQSTMTRYPALRHPSLWLHASLLKMSTALGKAAKSKLVTKPA